MRRRNPFDEFERMLERFGRQFDQFDQFEEGPTSVGGISLDVEDRDAEYVVTADLPGFERDDIDVRLDENTLRIAADRDTRRERTTDGEYIYQERSRSSASRSVRLPERVEEAEASASYRNGVLTIVLPKVGDALGDGTDIPVN